MFTTSFHPPSASAPNFYIRYAHSISLGCHQLYIVIVANACACTQGPFWLPWRIILVGQGNCLVGQGNSSGVELKQFRALPDVRFLFLPFLPTPPPKREYNAVSAVADEVWQYRTGGNLTIFSKDHDTAEEG